MAPQFQHILHPALQTEGAFCDQRRMRQCLRRKGGQFHGGKFIHIPAGLYAAPIRSIGEFPGGEIYDKFPGLPDQSVGIPLRAHGNRDHHRIGAYRSGPRDGHNVLPTVPPGTAYHNRRHRIEHISRLPHLFLVHNRVPPYICIL